MTEGDDRSLPLPRSLEVRAIRWPEITTAHDLAQLLADTAELRDGDVIAVTSKVVSKAEGQVVSGERARAIEVETDRVVARRASSVIAETRHGLVMAAAGVDASNTPPGTVVLLPVDSDVSARRLRERLRAVTGLNVAVVVTDTVGRAWRNGQTDLAIGCAGLPAIVELSGSRDTHGNELVLTAPAIADEVAGATDLVKGKASGCPVAVVTGLGPLVLAPGEDGEGAAALIRPSALDLFGLGTREAAVAAALRADPVALAHFPQLVAADIVPLDALTSVHPQVRVEVTADAADGSDNADESLDRRSWRIRVDVEATAGPAAYLDAGAITERVRAVAAAYRLVVSEGGRPLTEDRGVAPTWRTVACLTCSAP